MQLYLIQDDRTFEEETERTTLGTHTEGDLGLLNYRVEAAWQGGSVRGEDLSASFLGLRGTLPVLQGKGDATLWYDRYSGSDTPGPNGAFTSAFSDLYGRNHRFLGFADIFSQLPRETMGRGIEDRALRFGWATPDGGRLGVDLHHFTATAAAGLTGDLLADELDLTWTTRSIAALDLIGGVSWVWAGDAGRELGIVPENQFVSYLMVEARF